MENYTGLIIAVENYHDSKNLRSVKFAENDAESFLNCLIQLGCDKDKLDYLPSQLATKTTIVERIKQISQYASPADTIIFYFAGHGFFHNGLNLISCVDTSLTSLPDTTIDINFILSSFDKSKSNKVIAFLDCCHSGIEFSEIERSPVNDFSTDSLKYDYSNAEHLIVFASCKSDEKSHADLERKHGVWSYFLITALNGEAKRIYESDLLFSDKLQKYLADNTYHRVRMITPEKKNQTPVKFGKETSEKFIVADLTKIFEKREIKGNAETIKFEKAIILITEEDWVRTLPGFHKEKNHKPPKLIDEYHDSWIKTISIDLIEKELNQVAETLRKKLKYKRNDIEEPVIEDGAGQLRTIDFDYVVTISQSKEHADMYILMRSIENFKNTEILGNMEFNEIFNSSFDNLEFYLTKKINVEATIDIVEEIDNENLISVKYERTNTKNCTIRVSGFEGEIFLSERLFRITVDNKESPQNLILLCQTGYKALLGQGIQKMLE